MTFNKRKIRDVAEYDEQYFLDPALPHTSAIPLVSHVQSHIYHGECIRYTPTWFQEDSLANMHSMLGVKEPVGFNSSDILIM